MEIPESTQNHPILRGVSSVWVRAGAYWTAPLPDSEILAWAQPLEGMSLDAPGIAEKPPCPGAWVRTYRGHADATGRVFTTTYGASEDLLNEGFRRMLVNACYWATGLEVAIDSEAPVDFVGPYHPTPFRMGGHSQHVKPSELAGWDAPIMPPDKPIAPPKENTNTKRSKLP